MYLRSAIVLSSLVNESASTRPTRGFFFAGDIRTQSRDAPLSLLLPTVALALSGLHVKTGTVSTVRQAVEFGKASPAINWLCLVPCGPTAGGEPFAVP